MGSPQTCIQAIKHHQHKPFTKQLGQQIQTMKHGQGHHYAVQLTTSLRLAAYSHPLDLQSNLLHALALCCVSVGLAAATAAAITPAAHHCASSAQAARRAPRRARPPLLARWRNAQKCRPRQVPPLAHRRPVERRTPSAARCRARCTHVRRNHHDGYASHSGRRQRCQHCGAVRNDDGDGAARAQRRCHAAAADLVDRRRQQACGAPDRERSCGAAQGSDSATEAAAAEAAAAVAARAPAGGVHATASRHARNPSIRGIARRAGRRRGRYGWRGGRSWKGGRVGRPPGQPVSAAPAARCLTPVAAIAAATATAAAALTDAVLARRTAPGRRRRCHRAQPHKGRLQHRWPQPNAAAVLSALALSSARALRGICLAAIPALRRHTPRLQLRRTAAVVSLRAATSAAVDAAACASQPAAHAHAVKETAAALAAAASRRPLQQQQRVHPRACKRGKCATRRIVDALRAFHTPTVRRLGRRRTCQHVAHPHKGAETAIVGIPAVRTFAAECIVEFDVGIVDI
eukprot:359754-Chlamydomonas_euryale.AAC.3